MAGPINERVATLEARLEEVLRRVNGHGGTLYGMQGNGGLQGDVRTLITIQDKHLRDTADVLDKHVVLLVGEHGDGGLVADVASFKRVTALAKALGAAVLALLGKLAYDGFQWLRKG